MSCGKAVCDDDAYWKIYERKLNKLENFSYIDIVHKLDNIRRLVCSVNKETDTGSRYLFRLIDDLSKEVDWENWKS